MVPAGGMIPTTRELADLERDGWVRVDGNLNIVARLEQTGVPLYMLTLAPQIVAPLWAVKLVQDWPPDIGWELLLKDVVVEAHRRNDPHLAEAAIATLRLGGEQAVIHLLFGEQPL
jgi:hypothetical protein